MNSPKSAIPISGRQDSMDNRADALVPDFLRDLFWDCRFEDLRLPGNWPYVIGRVLASGTWAQIEWLRKRVGDQDLRQWILAGEGCLLDPPQLRFWELILDLPSRKVDCWLDCRSNNGWDDRISKKPHR